MDIKQYIGEYWIQLIIWSVAIASSIIIGSLAARFIPVYNDNQVRIDTLRDTIYIERNMTDSLLKDISNQVHEINVKIPIRNEAAKHRRSTRPTKDTLRVD